LQTKRQFVVTAGAGSFPVSSALEAIGLTEIAALLASL
jgi:hypothetical protein